MKKNKKNLTTEKTLKTKRRIFIFCMLALPILQYLVFFVYVNISSVTMSFQVRTIDSVNVSLGNYRRFFNELGLGEIGYAVRNSFLVGLNDLFLLCISLILSYFFFKKIPGAGVFKVIFFLPSIISIVIFVMVFKYMFDPDMGIVNVILKSLGVTELPEWFAKTSEWQMPLILLYCLWVGTGYNVLIMGGAMANLPEDVMEYSRLEGVGMGRELFGIIIPMIWPTVSVGILGSVTAMFTLFIQVDLMTGGGALHQSTTISYMINSVIRGGTDLEWASTLGVCFTIIAAPIIVITRKLLNKASEHFGF